MLVIKLNKGEEVKLKPGFTEYWLNEIVRDGKEDTEILTYEKPSYPSEFDALMKLRCNYNYDGMAPTITFDPETKMLKAQGYGYNTITLTFN